MGNFASSLFSSSSSVTSEKEIIPVSNKKVPVCLVIIKSLFPRWNNLRFQLNVFFLLFFFLLRSTFTQNAWKLASPFNQSIHRYFILLALFLVYVYKGISMLFFFSQSTSLLFLSLSLSLCFLEFIRFLVWLICIHVHSWSSSDVVQESGWVIFFHD